MLLEKGHPEDRLYRISTIWVEGELVRERQRSNRILDIITAQYVGAATNGWNDAKSSRKAHKHIQEFIEDIRNGKCG